MVACGWAGAIMREGWGSLWVDWGFNVDGQQRDGLSVSRNFLNAIFWCFLFISKEELEDASIGVWISLGLAITSKPSRTQQWRRTQKSYIVTI